MPNLSVVGDLAAGSCTHVQMYFPYPTLTFAVGGLIPEGSGVAFAGGRPIAVADPLKKFPHTTGFCQGTGSTNLFSINATTPVMWVEGKPAAFVGDATTHCGGAGVVTGPGMPTIF